MRSGRKTTPILAGVLAGLLSTVVIGNWRRAHPNVLLIVVDSMRGDVLQDAFEGARLPNLRALQAEGVVFPLAFSNSPVTLPAHVAIHSGRHPHETGLLANGQIVDPGVTLLPEWLRDHGYQTMAVVSLDKLQPPREGQGIDRGFELFDPGTEPVERADSVVRRVKSALNAVNPNDSFLLLAHFADPHEPYSSYDGKGPEAHVRLDDQFVGGVRLAEEHRWEYHTTLRSGEHVLELSSDAGIRLRDFAYEHRGRAMPFDVRVGDFLGSSERIVIRLVNPSDAPIDVTFRARLNDTPPLLELRDRYRQEIEAVDRAVGQIVADLKRRGLYDDTIIVFTSGHGEALGEHGHVGHEVSLFDELLHVPLFIRLPQGWTEKRIQLLENSLDIARHVDLAPTLLDLLEIRPWVGISGVSLLADAPRTVVATTAPPAAARTLHAMRDHHYKLVLDPAAPAGFQMYRLNADPLELDDVFAHQGHMRREWQHQLRSLTLGLR